MLLMLSHCALPPRPHICGKLESLLQPAKRAISSTRLSIQTLPESDRPKMPRKEELVFGRTFAPHMLQVRFCRGKWQAPEIVPFQDLQLNPAAAALHYGLECFEGMKAYRADASNPGTGDVDLRLFRPDLNMRRLQNSMDRLAMPGSEFVAEDLIRCIGTLVRVDQAFVPPGDGGYSLYIRPTVIATHPFLGLSPPDDLLLYVITSPAGPYYASGFAPVRLTADAPYVRAWPGGAGGSKVGGNYGPTMKPGAEANARGYGQILWTFGADDEVTEAGAMNVFFFLETGGGAATRRELVTPPLDRGDILPGVTRQSILEMARAWGEFDVAERPITMPEVRTAAAEGRLIEAFCAGTAAVVTPISHIRYHGEDIEIAATGHLTERIFSDLTGIQYGRIEGPDGWSVKI